jgi:ATP-dependent DNA helicase RecQ
MALAMHPQIFSFDGELRSLSEALANITGDYEEQAVAAEISAIDEILCRKLKDWRMRRATADNVPAYIIAHKTVLEALASRPPQTVQALRGVKGFGPKKIESYGQEIIDVIAAHAAGK